MNVALLAFIGPITALLITGLTILALKEPGLYRIFFPYLVGAIITAYAACGVWSSATSHASTTAFEAMINSRPLGDMAAMSAADIVSNSIRDTELPFGWITLSEAVSLFYLGILRIIPDLRDALEKKPPSDSH